MKKYTHITYWRDEEEIQASIYSNSRLLTTFSILGDWEDDEDIELSLADEAGRLGYEKIDFADYGSKGGKLSAAKLTKEERVARAKRAVQAREAKKKK